MAQLHKLTVYITDPNDNVTLNDILVMLNQNEYDLVTHVFHEASSPEFYWEDDVICNRYATPEQLDLFMIHAQ